MERSRHFRVYALLLFALANLLNYANRNAILHTRVYGDLRGLYDLSNAELGFLGTTAFMVPHALATLFWGWLGDRTNRKHVLAAGMLLFSAAALSVAWRDGGFAGVVGYRVLSGIGCAACVPVVNAMLGRLFERQGRARAISVFNLGLFLGGVIGFGAGWLFGFPRAVIFAGLPGFALALAILALKLPEGVASRNIGKTRLVEFTRAAWGTKALRRMYAGGVLMAFASGAYLAWFTEFLEKDKHLDPVTSWQVLLAVLMAGLCGVLCGGAIADVWIRKHPAGRQYTVASSLVIAVPCSVLAIALPQGAAFTVSSCALMFFMNWYHAPIAAGIEEQTTADRAATVQGVYIFLMHILGTAPSGFVVGMVSDQIGLQRALYVPTAAVALAGVMFLSSGLAVVWKKPS
jgi:MFS family permease